MYYRPETNQVFKLHGDIRAALWSDSGIIFPDVVTDSDLADVNIYRLEYDMPQVAEGMIATPLSIEEIDGIWTQLWTTRPATESELEASKPKVPFVVSRRQARQALLLRGLLGKVPALLDAIEDEMQRELSKIEWEDATEFVRARPLVIQIGLALGLNEAGLDELFIFAATL